MWFQHANTAAVGVFNDKIYVAADMQLTIDDALATVLYAGRAPGFTGLNQINVLLPADIKSGGHVVRVTRKGVTGNQVMFRGK